jgi:hypothetical protein
LEKICGKLKVAAMRRILETALIDLMWKSGLRRYQGSSSKSGPRKEKR